MNKEQVYDAEISPLIKEIVAICQRNKIAMIAHFHIPNDDYQDLQCATSLMAPEYDAPEKMKAAVKLLNGGFYTIAVKGGDV